MIFDYYGIIGKKCLIQCFVGDFQPFYNLIFNTINAFIFECNFWPLWELIKSCVFLMNKNDSFSNSFLHNFAIMNRFNKEKFIWMIIWKLLNETCFLIVQVPQRYLFIKMLIILELSSEVWNSFLTSLFVSFCVRKL